jgi:uracil phosphoribosyltransferase
MAGDIVLGYDGTAGSKAALEVAKRVMKQGRPKRLAFFSVIATMQGINHVAKAFPKAEFYTCAVDHTLNEHGYILPGLGDAGDRAFGPPP